ncbi:MAG TPA: hypothetical protein VLE70_16740 [Anaerolineae bacterium]|nr:hypothetical protein [Anaerolineae bacterium]
MNIGMLWLDDDKQTSLEDKVLRAADYYREKYGQAPNLCLVNKTMVEDERRVGKIQVQPVKNVLPNHFWLGVSTG